MTPYTFSIIRPGGNITALVEGLVPQVFKKSINDALMKRYSVVEQVGFYQYIPQKKLYMLEMAGGEFCGNALRSLAYLVLAGGQGEITCKVSGVKQTLKAGVIRRREAYAQIPIIKSKKTIKKLYKNIWLVDLEGISHLIKLVSRKLAKNAAKSDAKALLIQTGLLQSKAAAGVMFVRQNKLFSNLEIEPIVWVRKIETFFYETACASGTAAVGLWYLFNQNKNLSSICLNVKQPSKEYLQVKISKTRNQSLKIFIEGPVKILKSKGIISL